MEQREFVEKMCFLVMAKEEGFSDYYSKRNLTGRKFYSVIDTLYECVAEDADYTVIIRRVKAYAATTGSGRTVPQIMLQGNWVKKWGFEAGYV